MNSFFEMARKDFHHPFEPYDIQQQFMETMYDCIEEGQVGIFESPTGTGKSLSLICGALTWLRQHKRRTFDEALATIEVGDDEPAWMTEHARESRSREIRQMRVDFEARLAAVRDREKKLKERLATGGPPFKRQKQSHQPAEDAETEDHFVLDDYESDTEHDVNHSTNYSTQTSKLMEKLGMMPHATEQRGAEVEEELKIYFCSRTHSQLSQFTGELKRLRLPPGLPPVKDDDEEREQDTEEIKHLTLGSRKNLCINPKVAGLPSQVAVNERCIELQQSNTPADKKCAFLPNKDSEDLVLDFRDHALATIRDIEDLARLGTRLQICPYYATRPAINPAEIVTLPYPLLLQKAAREALGISLKGHVVVIDEAHNLMNAVEGICSAQISDLQLRRAKDGLIVYLQKFRNRLKGSNRGYLAQVVRVIDSLLQFTSSVGSQDAVGAATSTGALLAGKAVDQINLSKLVRYINESKLARKVEGYIGYLATEEANKNKKQSKGSNDIAAEVPTLTHVQNFLLALMNPSREGNFLWSKESGNVVIQYLLMDPSEHFREIVEDARAVILAGGTMSPIDDYRQQLFPYLDSLRTFSCGHLIPRSSLFVRAVISDAEGRLEFSFKARNDASARRMGRAIEETASKVKGGLVVFFPSYGYLDSVMRLWQSESIISRLNSIKPVFSDSRTTSAEETFKAYSETIQSDNRGALMLSVIGGKLSEGINFSDDLGRCVIVVGLPYPNLQTPEWKAKMQYLEERAKERGEPSGKASREHAENVCMRSVNQAIGRAIRHKNDWASILLFDARYADPRIQAKLPGWIRESTDSKATGSISEVTKGLESFFEGRKG